MRLPFLAWAGIFAGAGVLFYSIVPRKFRYVVLLALSLGIYILYNRFMAAFIVVTAVSVYAAGILVDKINRGYSQRAKELPKPERKQLRKKAERKKSAVLIAALFVNLAVLFVLKYFNFFSAALEGVLGWIKVDCRLPALKALMPLGISYYTLQALSYVIDVTQGKIEAERNFLKVSLFVCYFPQLSEGPFGRYGELACEMTKGDPIDGDNFYRGLLLALWGLFKVFIVSYRLSVYTSAIFGNFTAYAGWTVALGAVIFTLQLYTDFSGSIDVVRGISCIFGIRLAKNFDLPFLSKDVGEFWRRWHISLGAWFRDYVFYPVSMSSLSGKLREKLPLKVAEGLIVNFAFLCVWLLTGLWHGAAAKYVVYGLYYFALIVLHNALRPLVSKLYAKLKIREDGKAISVLRIAKTFVFVCVGMLLFRADTLPVFGQMFASLFKGTAGVSLLKRAAEWQDLLVMCLGVGIVALSGVLSARKVDLSGMLLRRRSVAVRYLVCFALVMVIVVFGAYGNGYLPPDPIYGGF